MGFQDEMSRLIKSLPGLRRHFLLSATEAEEIPRFVHMGRVEKIDYRMDEEQVPERVHIYKVESPVKDKLESLGMLLRSLGDQSTIVFLNYRDSVERTNQVSGGAGLLYLFLPWRIGAEGARGFPLSFQQWQCQYPGEHRSGFTWS